MDDAQIIGKIVEIGEDLLVVELAEEFPEEKLKEHDFIIIENPKQGKRVEICLKPGRRRVEKGRWTIKIHPAELQGFKQEVICKGCVVY